MLAKSIGQILRVGTDISASTDRDGKAFDDDANITLETGTTVLAMNFRERS